MAAPSIEDWFAVNALFTRYACALDHGDVDAVVACFSETATLESPILGTFTGHAGVRAFAERTAHALRERGAQFRHVVTNVRVQVDGDSARAQCYLLDVLTRDGRTELLSPGEYDCTLQRRHGEWVFERRVVRMDRLFSVDV